MPRKLAVAAFVDIVLEMLNANAHRKRFLLECNAHVVKKLKYIARRVTDRENKLVGLKRNLTVGSLAKNAGYRTVFYEYVAKLCVKENLTAKGLNLLAYARDNLREIVRADVRISDIHNFARCAVGNECGKNIKTALVVRARIEFSVREGSCAALTELNV